MTHRSFISLILAVALAVTGMTAAPARAGNDDVAKWIAGAVALGIIGAAISEERKRDRRRDDVVTRRYDDSQRHRWQGHDTRHGNFDGRWARDRQARYLLPEACRVRMRTYDGEIRGFGQQCLLRHYSYFNSLPHGCAVQVQGRHERTVYGGRCLHRYGYRVAESRK